MLEDFCLPLGSLGLQSPHWSPEFLFSNESQLLQSHWERLCIVRAAGGRGGGCNKPFGPKPEIQHNQRGRGMPTLTWEEVFIREGKRRCCSCTKMEIMSLGLYLIVIYKSVCKESCVLQHQQCQKVGVGTMPNARKNSYLVLDFYVQDWRWMESIFSSYLCDLVSSYWFLSGNIFSDSVPS